MVNIRTIFFAVSMIAMLITNCNLKDLYDKPDKLSLVQTSYIGNQLRIDGYYYYNYNSAFDNQKMYEIYFFYQNGVLLGGTSWSEKQLKEAEAKFADGSYAKNAQKYIYEWGLFQIIDTNIKFEKWNPGPPTWAMTREGYIINDTTFRLTKIYHIVDGEKDEQETLNQTYYFKKFSPKPDSTNTFIK